MIKYDNVIRFLISISLIVFLFTGMIIHTDLRFFSNNLFILMSGSIIIIVSLYHNKGISNFSLSYLDILYFAFIAFGLLSSILNREPSYFLAIIKMAAFYFILVFSNRITYKTVNDNIFLFSFLVSSMIVIVATVLNESPIGSANYQSLFYNPNNLGTFIATVFTLAFSGFFINFNKIKYTSILLLISIVSLYLSFVSSSRTSLLAIALIILITVFLYIIKSVKDNYIIKKVSIVFIGLIFLGCIILVYNNNYRIIIDFLADLTNKSNNAVITRPEIWRRYIEHASLFGSEAGYMRDVTSHSAHNTFLEQIGRYGWFAGMFYLAFWVMSLYEAYKYVFNNIKKDSFSLIQFNSILLFIIMSITEILTHSIPMYTALYFVGRLTIKADETRILKKSNI